MFAHGRAKKIQNKAVVNTSTLMRESKAENNKVLLTRGNSRMAGKLSLESVPGPGQAGSRMEGGTGCSLSMRLGRGAANTCLESLEP